MPVKPLPLSPWQRKVAGLVQSVDSLNSLVLAGGRRAGKSILLVWVIGYFAKIQGEDLSHFFWDELTLEPDPQLVLRGRSSMRTTDPVVVPKFIATCDPLGLGSWWVRDYIVSKQLPCRMWRSEFFGGGETGWIQSTLRDNPHLSNPDQYETELKASCFGNEIKIAAEVYSDWGQFTAGFLGACLSIERTILPSGLALPFQGVDGPEHRRKHQ